MVETLDRSSIEKLAIAPIFFSSLNEIELEYSFNLLLNRSWFI